MACSLTINLFNIYLEYYGQNDNGAKLKEDGDTADHVFGRRTKASPEVGQGCLHLLQKPNNEAT